MYDYVICAVCVVIAVRGFSYSAWLWHSGTRSAAVAAGVIAAMSLAPLGVLVR